MNCSFRKAWSTAGSLKRTTSFDGEPKKLFRRLPKRSPESISYYGGSRLRRTGNMESSSGLSTYSFEHYGSGKNDGLFSINAKQTMMTLNDRLATYLEKVASLEEENQRLERKIKEWYEKHAPQQLPDYSKYWKIIEELNKEIFDARMDNTQILLHIDNARLAVDDLQTKYNMELSMRNTVEADVIELRRGLDGLTLERCDLEFQIEHLTEDLMLLKKDHNEEVKNLKEQLGARVHVEVDVAPAEDIKKVLSNIRKEYESLMERNLNDVEKWFVAQSEEINSQMVSGAEQLQTVKSEAIDLRHTIQNLEIDLQAQLSTISALEGTLAETEESYSFQLAEIQELVDNIEATLAQKRYDLEWQNNEYKILTDVKTRLEMEIETYKCLLEAEDIPAALMFMDSESWGKKKNCQRICGKSTSSFQLTGNRGLKIVSIIEDYQDGKVISKYEKVHHLQL